VKLVKMKFVSSVLLWVLVNVYDIVCSDVECVYFLFCAVYNTGLEFENGALSLFQ